MTKSVFVIGDIAGEFKAFLALLEKVPGDTKIISMGDAIDRGPDSRQVVEWFMQNQHRSLLGRGNHEDFAIKVSRKDGTYNEYSWISQGGQETLDSFGGEIPPDVLSFLATRKYFSRFKIGEQRFFVSHAFAETIDALDLSSEKKKMAFVWNRGTPNPSKNYTLQIAGHNSHFGLRWFSDDSNQQYAVGIDTSASKILTGISLPSREIFQQPYLS
jgi:serine/threonine protein phosphatase 1